METVHCSLLAKAMIAAALLLADIAGASCDKPLRPLMVLSRVVVEFKVKVMGVMPVSGQFHNVQGNFIWNGSAAESAPEITICINSVDTQSAGRDSLLRSAAFFDAERFPTIRFTGFRLVNSTDGTRYLTGDLTLHGVKRAVAFRLMEPEHRNLDGAGTATTYAATATINRREFGLDAFRMIVSDDVEITVRVEDRFADMPNPVFSGLSSEYGQMPFLQY